MKTTTIALIAGAGMFAAASALANHHEGKKDGDHDWEAKFEEKFNKVDANGDGNVTGEEFLAYKQAKAEEEWAEMAEAAGDDGAFSLEEAKAHHKAMKEKKKEKMKEMHDEMKDDMEDGEE